MFGSGGLRTRKDGITHDIQKKEQAPYTGPAEELKKYEFERAARNGYGKYEQAVIVSGGDTEHGEELFPDAVQTLDFYHPAENLYSFGKYLFQGDEKRRAPWAEELAGLTRESKAGEVLNRLEAYKEHKLPPGIVNPCTYIRHNRGKADYGEYKRRGYCIGSEPIESANKTAVQRRCRQAGMLWNETNATGTYGSAIC
ncbi:MAG: hypothetical protein LBG27_07485 [Spirochaetaceae bacterium]|nr:hypothetical protein [Spirochaetaceae bacterium]